MAIPRSDLPTGTVTFLFSDIEGSTRLAHDLGAMTYRDLLEQHHRLLRNAFETHGGVERGTQGDAFLVVFRDARSAIGAAIDAQRALAGASWPADVSVRVRMGLHSGEGIRGGDDYVGLDVNRAARIAAAAHGGQILVSDATRALAERDLPAGAGFRDLGEHSLKDLDRPEHLYQVNATGLPSEFPAPRSLSSRTTNLPAQVTSFVGRERELHELRRLLPTTRLLTLIGPSGTGKTRLLIEAASALQSEFPAGTWFVALTPVADHRRVGNAVAAAIGVAEAGEKRVEDVVVDYLRHRRTLLVLDSFEHVLPAVSLVDRILRECGTVAVAVTSQSPLRLSGEQLYPVAPLDLTAAPSETGGSEAARLFAQRAALIRPDFRLTDENGPIVAAICRRLDGLPLALELAAARSRILPPQALLERLDRALSILAASSSDLPERHRTMRAAIAWSVGLLEPDQAALLRRLAVFAGGGTLAAIEAVASDGLPADALSGLDDLVGHSLVIADVGEHDARFRMLQTIREFAQEQLVAADEEAAVRTRHARWYRDAVERLAPALDRGDIAATRVMRPEIDNIRATLRWALQAGDVELGLRTCAAAWRVFRNAGLLREGREWCETFLALSVSTGLERPRMGVLAALGGLTYWLGDRPAALRAYRERLALAESLGSDSDRADALLDLAFGLLAADQLEDGRETAGEARALYARLGDELGVARCTWLILRTDRPEDSMATTQAVLRDVLPIVRKHGDVLYEGIAAGDLAWKAALREDLEESRLWARRSLTLQHASEDVPSVLLTMRGASLLAFRLGRIEPAARIMGAVDVLSDTYGVGLPRNLELTLQLLGLGDVQAAIATLADAGSTSEATHMTLDEVVTYTLASL